MKISLKLQDDHRKHQKHHHQPPLLLRAKIPITIFNFPFLSHFSTTTTHPSDLSLSLSTNFPSFPSLKISYATAASSAATTPPLCLTLKSGTGLFGSPNNSPFVISAHFSFNPCNPNHPTPTFSLLFKPQLGSFSLRKSTFSHPESSVSSQPTNGGDDSNSFGFVPLERPTISSVSSQPTNSGDDSNSFGFVPLERPTIATDISVEKNDKDSIFKGIQVAATTRMPVAKRAALNFRWWVNFAEDQIPVLRINKIGIQRVDDASNGDDEKKKKSDEAKAGEIEVLKGMCFWMKRELDVLTRVNREMKCELEEMRAGHLARPGRGFGGGDFKEGVQKKAMPSGGSPSGGFKQWRSTRNGGGEENGNSNSNSNGSGSGNVSGKREEKKNGNLASDVENELQRAIKAAAAASASP